MTQMCISEHIKRFGDKGGNALLKELNQLYERNALFLRKRKDFPTTNGRHTLVPDDFKKDMTPYMHKDAWMVVKLLYSSRRSRQDIQMAEAFLCTRVQKPDMDDYKKLAKVIQCLWGTCELTLTIDPSDHPSWWVYSSYTVQLDMRSHSGIFMTLGKGAPYSTSSKQKHNTKSLTEAEWVALDDLMVQLMWTRHFIAVQSH